MKRLILLFSMLCIATLSQATGLVDLKFGQAQIADSQWNVQACTQTATCQIYSKNPGTVYKIPWWSGQIQWAAGDYIQFQANTTDANNPWLAVQYGANGVGKTNMGTGHIINMGSDYFFFVGNDNDTGQLFSMTTGFSNTAGVTWTGTLNPSTTQVDQYAAGGSTTPLAAGQTAPPPAGGGGGGATWPATSDITIIQTTQKIAAKGRVSSNQLGNSIYIDEKIGSSSNNVTIEQTGNFNKISGVGGTEYAVINGDSNTINIKQGDTIGKNLIEFNVTGNANTVSIWQARNPTTGLQDASESGGHYMGLNINGNTNTLSLKQSNDGGTTSGHFAYVDVTGNNNNGTLKQSGNGEKTFFGIINGSTNVFDVTQQGSGSYFDLNLTGNGHSVTANQKDAGSHKATINLTNAGGASNVTLVQQGSTAQNINITQQCATLSGCSVSVTQGY